MGQLNSSLLKFGLSGRLKQISRELEFGSTQFLATLSDAFRFDVSSMASTSTRARQLEPKLRQVELLIRSNGYHTLVYYSAGTLP